MGFEFNETLSSAQDEGIREGWYDATLADGDGMGTEFWSLGDIFDSQGVPYDRMGASEEWSGAELPQSDAALERLHDELREGRLPVVNFVATDVGLVSWTARKWSHRLGNGG